MSVQTVCYALFCVAACVPRFTRTSFSSKISTRSKFFRSLHHQKKAYPSWMNESAASRSPKKTCAYSYVHPTFIQFPGSFLFTGEYPVESAQILCGLHSSILVRSASTCMSLLPRLVTAGRPASRKVAAQFMADSLQSDGKSALAKDYQPWYG